MRVTMKELAAALGVTQGTVSKALHDRPGISEGLRCRIKRKAEEMGYRVNRVAQTLSRHTLQIGVLLPEEWPDLYDEVADGIRDKVQNLQDYNVQIHIRTVPEGQYEQVLRTLAEYKLDGLLCSWFIDAEPDGRQTVRRILEEDRDIPVLLVVSDASKRQDDAFGIVASDSYLQGRLAAEYMRHLVPANAAVAVMTGQLAHTDHRRRVDGFRDTYCRDGRTVLPLIEAQDQPQVAEQKARALLTEHPELQGLYISTGNSEAVCRTVTQMGFGDRVHIICTDLFAGILPYMEEGGPVDALVYQDLYRQGRKAVRLLYDALSGGAPLPAHTSIVPQLLLRCNAAEVWRRRHT